MKLLCTAIFTTAAFAQTYNVQTCAPGQFCRQAQVTVTPQSQIDSSIPLQGTNVAEQIARAQYQGTQTRLMRQRADYNDAQLRMMRQAQQIEDLKLRIKKLEDKKKKND